MANRPAARWMRSCNHVVTSGHYLHPMWHRHKVDAPCSLEFEMPKQFEIEKLVDSMATISEIIFNRLKTMECNQCQPCGDIFMKALTTLREAGNVAPGAIAGRSGKSSSEG